jgi:hypothetical protein
LKQAFRFVEFLAFNETISGADSIKLDIPCQINGWEIVLKQQQPLKNCLKAAATRVARFLGVEQTKTVKIYTK